MSDKKPVDPTVNPQVTVKPALITDDQQKRKMSGIVWDEWTIAEHDKERGTRQIIDEPKTPFEKMSEVSEVKLSIEEMGEVSN